VDGAKQWDNYKWLVLRALGADSTFTPNGLLRSESVPTQDFTIEKYETDLKMLWQHMNQIVLSVKLVEFCLKKTIGSLFIAIAGWRLKNVCSGDRDRALQRRRKSRADRRHTVSGATTVSIDEIEVSIWNGISPYIFRTFSAARSAFTSFFNSWLTFGEDPA